MANTPTNSISVYRSDQDGGQHPIMTIEGSKTKLDGPIGLAFDSTGKLYVVNHGVNSSVTVYAALAHGNVAPLRVLEGTNTRLRNIASPADYPWGSIAVDLVHDRLFVGRVSPDQVAPYALDVLIFPATASGNVAPLGSIGYPNQNTTIYSDPGLFGSNFPPAILFAHDGDELIISNEQFDCCHGSDGWLYYRASDLKEMMSYFSFYANGTLIGPALKPRNGTLVATGYNEIDIWPGDVTGEEGAPQPSSPVPLSVLENPYGGPFTAVATDSEDTTWALSGSTILEGFEAGHATPRVITGLVGASAIATIPVMSR